MFRRKLSENEFTLAALPDIGHFSSDFEGYAGLR